MSKFLVQKTVYLSIEVEGDTWIDAMQKSNAISHVHWKYNDEETPCVVCIDQPKLKVVE
jgi:hypothetical protein